MKVFIASENVRHGIIMSNALSASGASSVQNDTNYADAGSMLDDISSNIQLFDICFAISRKPIDMVISANRIPSLRAVFCKNASDIVDARKAGANVIIIDSSSVSRESIDSMIKDWLSNDGLQVSSIAKTISSIVGMKDRVSSAALGTGTQAVKQKQRKKQDQEYLNTDDDFEDTSRKPRSGIMGKLKDAFGFD